MIPDLVKYVYGLTYHYVGGKEALGLSNTQVGRELSKGLDDFDALQQVSGSELLLPVDNQIEIPDIADKLIQAVEKRLNEAGTNKVSLSVTGGFDSRILLSILKKIDVEIHGYTYGNPQSIDCLVAKEVSESINIPYDIHDIKYDKTSFDISARRSIKTGNFVCSLHRAHRVDAIIKESEYADAMFLGTMGGEFVKGASIDNIVPNFVCDYITTPDISTIQKYMSIRALRPNGEIAHEIMQIMNHRSYVQDPENMELHVLLDVASKLHHNQNLIQYTKYIPHVFTPFCDKEYLELLFRSKFNFLHRRKTQTPYKYKLDNPRFGATMQNYLNPRLARIPYANGFSASEYLTSPYWAALKARYRKSRTKTPPNFPLGKWMEDFVKEKLKEILGSESLVANVFDIPRLLSELNRTNLPQVEAFWLKYTTPIQMYLTEELIRQEL